MHEYRRQGKHTIRVGDLVRVSGATVHIGGVHLIDRGFRGQIERIYQDGSGQVVVDIVRVGVRQGQRRTVAADRLTRIRQTAPTRAVA